MIKKTLLLLLILCLPLSGMALADSGSSGVGYFTKESATIISNIVLFPFRLLRDIFDPPPPPTLVPYYYSPAPIVVSPPAPPTTYPAVAPSAPLPQASVNNSFEINIPNGNGSSTSVTLTKTEKGFLGPQGEFYADHPTEEQLKARYLKK